MVKRKKMNIFLKILVVFFFIYMAFYIINMSGYYEGKIREKTALTEEGIKEFEKRIQNGEDVDIKSFLNDERVDYSNNLSNIGDSLTSGIEGVIVETSKIVINILNSLF